MRTVIVILLLFFHTVFYSCNKSSGTAAPVTLPVSAAITITSISPASPYANDEITITGTGFNPDKTKDTVDFGGGDPASGIFNPYLQGQGTSSKAVVISASATQLVIKAVNPDSSASGLVNQKHTGGVHGLPASLTAAVFKTCNDNFHSQKIRN